MFSVRLCLAADAPTAAPASEAAKDAAPPTLPAYFSAPTPTRPSRHGPIRPAARPASGPRRPATARATFPRKLTNTDLYDRIAHNLFSINMVWVLIAGFLVMFMQAGFAMVETGLCRAKNAAHTIGHELHDLSAGLHRVLGLRLRHRLGQLVQRPGAARLVFVARARARRCSTAAGHRAATDAAAATGAFTYGLLGTKGFFLNGLDDVSVMALFFFMMVFMDTTATIPTGAMAERWSWKNFCLYGLWVALPYCLYANWVWGGGWLAQARHELGAGARGGRLRRLGGGPCDGRRHRAWPGRSSSGRGSASSRERQAACPFPATTCRWSIVGTFILAFGWFGFNPGSTLAGTDLRISVVVVNTMLAGIAGALAVDADPVRQGHEARPHDDVQRHAGRPGGDHRAVCLRR